MLVVLMGFLGLATDVGYLLFKKRLAQTAADSGAVYGTQAFRRGKSDAVIEATAVQGAEDNGFTHGEDGVTVTALHPAPSGEFAAVAGSVEVTVCQDQPPFFMQILGYTSAGVCARGVAAMTDSPSCIFALNPSDEKTFYVSSSGANLPANCGITVNSTNPTGLWVDSGACLTVESISVTGNNYHHSGSPSGPCLGLGFGGGSNPVHPEPILNSPPEVDPLGHLPAVSFVDSCISSSPQTQIPPSPTSMSPGVYCKGVQISGGDVTMAPGVYVIAGEKFEVSGAGTRVSGSNVLIYLTESLNAGFEGKGLEVGSGSEFDITGITTPGDPFEGIAIYVDRALPGPDKAPVFFASASQVSVNGAIYAKNQLVQNHSESFATSVFGGLAIVADRVWVDSSNSTLDVRDDFSSFAGGSPINRPTLVE